MVTYKEREDTIGSIYTFYKDNKIIGVYDDYLDDFVLYTNLSIKELNRILEVIGG